MKKIYKQVKKNILLTQWAYSEQTLEIYKNYIWASESCKNYGRICIAEHVKDFGIVNFASGKNEDNM